MPRRLVEPAVIAASVFAGSFLWGVWLVVDRFASLCLDAAEDPACHVSGPWLDASAAACAVAMAISLATLLLGLRPVGRRSLEVGGLLSAGSLLASVAAYVVSQ